MLQDIDIIRKVTAKIISEGPEACKVFLAEAGILSATDEIVTVLIKECRRVKLQRNQYEEDLRLANREIVRLKTELKLLTT